MDEATRMVARIGDRLWIKSYDLEARNGVGVVIPTADKAEALTMSSVDWFRAYKSSPTCRPLRDDGKPNRPLTGIPALMFEPAEDPFAFVKDIDIEPREG